MATNLSPLARSKLKYFSVFRLFFGPIPACAEQIENTCLTDSHKMDLSPLARSKSYINVFRKGLFWTYPRLRGANDTKLRRAVDEDGPIPACAEQILTNYRVLCPFRCHRFSRKISSMFDHTAVISHKK